MRGWYASPLLSSLFVEKHETVEILSLPIWQSFGTKKMEFDSLPSRGQTGKPGSPDAN